MAQASVATIIDTNPKRIGAAAGQQDLRASKRFKRMHLGSIAATDADHDFKKSGRTGGAFGFSPDAFFRDTNAVKTIGTPFNPFARELMSEYEVLDMFIPFIRAGTPKARHIDDFRAYFLKETPIPNFFRYAEDRVPYTIRSKKVATIGADDNRRWLQTSKQLYDFLSPGKPLVFTIDAVNVPFYEGLTLDDRGGAVARNAVYLRTREGAADAVGKKSIAETPGKSVNILTQEDDRKEHIQYPSTEANRIDALDESELFFSNFTITIPPITIVKDIRLSTFEFTNTGQTKQNETVKSVVEGKKKYSVFSISQRIKEFVDNFIRGGAGSANAANNYYIELQKKRACDWLQVQSCLDPARFLYDGSVLFRALAAIDRPKLRIKLFSEDRVCIAYDIAMGGDCAYTCLVDEVDETTSLWIVVIEKETAEMNMRDLCRREFDTLINPALPMNTKGGTLIGGNYREALTTYIERYNATEERNKRACEAAIAEANEFSDGAVKSNATIKDLVKKLLKAHVKLCSFRTLCNQLRSDDYENSYTRLQTLSTAAQNPTKPAYETARERAAKYRFQYEVLKVALGRDAVDVNTIDSRITYFFRHIHSSGTTKSIRADFQRDKLIERLDIFARLFSREKLNENGIGIMGYLNVSLTNPEKGALIGTLTKLRRAVESQPFVGLFSSLVGGRYTNLDKYDIFLKTASCLTLTESPAPTLVDIPTSEIQEALLLDPTDAGLSEADKAEIKEDKDVTNRDFFAAQVVLAGRMKGHATAAADRQLQQDLEDRLEREEQEMQESNATQGGGIGDEGSVKGEPGKMAAEILKYNHHPLTTFCYILRELNERLWSDDPDMCLISPLSHVIHSMMKSVPRDKPIEEIYDYLYSLEAIVLEELENYMPNKGVVHFMATIKGDYYGVKAIEDHKRFVKHSEEQVRAFIGMSDLGVEEQEKANDELMNTLMQYTGVMERAILEKLIPGSNAPISTSASRSTSSKQRKTMRRGHRLPTTYRRRNRRNASTQRIGRRQRHSRSSSSTRRLMRV